MSLAEEKHSTQEEQLDHLYKCISELDEIERIIISLALENLPQSEIASVLGLSHSNVRVKLHRIKERLARKMQNYERFN